MKRFLTVLALAAVCGLAAAKDYTVTSPDGHLSVKIDAGKALTYSIERDGLLLIKPSVLQLTLENGTLWGPSAQIKKAVTRSVDNTVDSPMFKRAQVRDHFNELELQTKEYKLVFRAYDDGIAWRFVPVKPVTVKAEDILFSFAQDWPAYIPYVNQHTQTLEGQFFSSQESHYTHAKISEWNKDRIAFLPITVEADKGIKLCIVEADLIDYPGMYLYNGTSGLSLKGMFAKVPASYEAEDGDTFQRIITSRKDVIAENVSVMPWRAVIVAPEAKDLAQSDMTWRLASPQAVADISWLKPGKVAWDWWNGWNLYGVDFEAGINTQTYKYYIDFAAANGIEYIVMDEGWAKNTVLNMKESQPDIDLPELVRYGKEKGVGIVLWTIARLFEDQMEELCAQYSAMGVKGWKIDFMDHDDQNMVHFYRNAAAMAAKYHMFVDFHGAYKPVGMSRTYPNVLNYEGVYGLENMKWGGDKVDQVAYDVTIPFTRLVAGPADYTQGAMRNAKNGNFRPVGDEPMSQGTRCHQLAEYVIFDAPLSMLCDSPSNYMREPECTAWIAAIPTVWDETVALAGEIGEYVVMARRKGSTWYVGALTNWDERDLELDLSFIPAGTKVQIVADGVNAHRAARDFKMTEKVLDGKPVKIHLAPGGGWVLNTK
ncbi:MAG: glycoside hydrolase family 97 protein [Bacteroidales bacterium]|nr:glycoside hydrolase family 97 protein [Bacteroidales bacterium]